MFSITVMSSGSEDYYIKRCSYYGLRRRKKKKRSKGDPDDDDSPDLDPDGAAPGFDGAEEHSIYLPGEPPGRWGGGAADFFNLSGIIQEEDYRRIYHGFHPHTGEPLVQNAGRPSRRPGWECCLSALKDFSILTFAVPAKWRKRFLKVFWKVVKDVLRMIEERFAFSRVGKAKNGCRSVPVRILAALWEHCSSRSLDEDLHIHIQLFNLGVDAEGKVRALDPLLIFRNQKLITAYFQAKLAAEIKEQFGLIVEADGTTYRIRGVPKDLVQEKSKRRQEILAYMAEHGQSGGKKAFRAAKITRSPKNYGISRAELMEKWRATNIAAGFDDAAIARLLQNAREEPDDDEFPEEDQADETPVVENVERTSPVVECDNATSIDLPPDTPEQSCDGKLPTEDQSEGPQEIRETASQVVECDGEAPTGLQPKTPQDLSEEYITSEFPIGGPPVAESVGCPSPTTTCIGGEASASADTQPGQATSQQETASYASWGSNYSSEKVGRRSTHRRMREWKNPPFPTNFGPVSYPSGRYSLSQRMALNRKEVIPKPKNARRISAVSKKLIRKAIVRATRRRNHFSQRELLYYTLYRLPRYGIDPRPVFEEVDHFLLHSPRIVPLGNDQNGEMRFATKLILENERRLLATFERMAKRPGRRVSERKLRKTLKTFASLNDEQKKFVRYLTQFSRAFRFGLGNAGVGKSYALKACFYACMRQGLRLHVLAPTGKTADDLARDTDVECQTLTKFLGDFLLPWPVRLRHHLRQFWRAARRRKTWRFRQPHPPKLTSRDIVVVDEAGMVGTRQMRILAELVECAGATLWLIGDPNQLPSVEGTPPLPTLAATYGAAYLKKIRRQKKAWAREAAQLFAEGYVVRALKLFLDHKHITVRDSLDELLQQVCWEWTEQGLHTPEQALIITNQNAVAHEVNQLCQEQRLNAGCIRSSPSIRITDEQEEDVYKSHVYCGDRVVFTQNTQPFPKGYGVKNGSRGTVVEIHSFMGEIVVLLDNSKLVKIPVRKYPHVRLGYAVTTYKSQSSSVPYIYAIVAGTDFPASYVQSTRAIERTLFYTTSNLLNADLENIAASPLAQQMSRRPDLRLASELLSDAPLELRRQKLRIRKSADHQCDSSCAPKNSQESQTLVSGEPTGNKESTPNCLPSPPLQLVTVPQVFAAKVLSAQNVPQKAASISSPLSTSRATIPTTLTTPPNPASVAQAIPAAAAKVPSAQATPKAVPGSLSPLPATPPIATTIRATLPNRSNVSQPSPQVVTAARSSQPPEPKPTAVQLSAAPASLPIAPSAPAKATTVPRTLSAATAGVASPQAAPRATSSVSSSPASAARASTIQIMPAKAVGSMQTIPAVAAKGPSAQATPEMDDFTVTLLKLTLATSPTQASPAKTSNVPQACPATAAKVLSNCTGTKSAKDGWLPLSSLPYHAPPTRTSSMKTTNQRVSSRQVAARLPAAHLTPVDPATAASMPIFGTTPVSTSRQMRNPPVPSLWGIAGKMLWKWFTALTAFSLQSLCIALRVLYGVSRVSCHAVRLSYSVTRQSTPIVVHHLWNITRNVLWKQFAAWSMFSFRSLCFAIRLLYGVFRVSCRAVRLLCSAAWLSACTVFRLLYLALQLLFFFPLRLFFFALLRLFRFALRLPISIIHLFCMVLQLLWSLVMALWHCTTGAFSILYDKLESIVDYLKDLMPEVTYQGGGQSSSSSSFQDNTSTFQSTTSWDSYSSCSSSDYSSSPYTPPPSFGASNPSTAPSYVSSSSSDYSKQLQQDEEYRRMCGSGWHCAKQAAETQQQIAAQFNPRY